MVCRRAQEHRLPPAIVRTRGSWEIASSRTRTRAKRGGLHQHRHHVVEPLLFGGVHDQLADDSKALVVACSAILRSDLLGFLENELGHGLGGRMIEDERGLEELSPVA